MLWSDYAQDVENLRDAAFLSIERADASIPKISSMRFEKIEIPGEKNAGISERACESAVIPVIARPSVIRSGMRHSHNARSTSHDGRVH